jgi:hypothetical protein
MIYRAFQPNKKRTVRRDLQQYDKLADSFEQAGFVASITIAKISICMPILCLRLSDSHQVACAAAARSSENRTDSDPGQSEAFSRA